MKSRTATNPSFYSNAARYCLPFLCATLATLLAVSFPSSAQKDGGRQNGSDFSELSRAPRKAIQCQNPLENDPDAPVAGAKLFRLHCAECHGSTADGGHKGPSLRAPEVQQASPGTLFWLLTNGVVRRGMPVWSKLPEPQRWQIVTYLKSLSPPASPQPAQASEVQPARIR